MCCQQMVMRKEHFCHELVKVLLGDVIFKSLPFYYLLFLSFFFWWLRVLWEREKKNCCFLFLSSDNTFLPMHIYCKSRTECKKENWVLAVKAYWTVTLTWGFQSNTIYWLHVTDCSSCILTAYPRTQQCLDSLADSVMNAANWSSGVTWLGETTGEIIAGYWSWNQENGNFASDCIHSFYFVLLQSIHLFIHFHFAI